MDSFESPAVLGEADKADIEAALATLGSYDEGASGATSAVTAIERILVAREMALTERILGSVRDELSSEPSTSTVRSVLASLMLAPPNWHQATVHFAATGNAGGTNSDDGAKAVGAQRAWSLLLGGALMVVGQCLAAVGVFVGTINQSCASSDQCQAGSYCHVGGSNRCLFCGSDAPLPGTDNGSPTQQAWSLGTSFHNKTLLAAVCAAPAEREPWAGNSFPATAVASWCETCVHSIDYTVDQVSFNTLVARNVAAMGPYDWVSLAFAATVVALAAVGELKDIELCEVARHHAGEKIPRNVRTALQLLAALRRWTFLPALVSIVPVLVMVMGGDALSVCLNAVAILFLTEIDNTAYWIILSDRSRCEVEKFGRADLTEVEVERLERSKTVHLLLIVIVVLAAVVIGNALATFMPLLIFWAGGLAEVISARADTSTGSRTEAVVKLTGWWLLGTGMFFTTMSAVS